MSEDRPAYGEKEEKVILIHVEELALFGKCPRCAYLAFHPNFRIAFKDHLHEEKAGGQMYSFISPEKVKVYSQVKGAAKKEKFEEYDVAVWAIGKEIPKESLADLSYAVGILNERDFPLSDENCSVCKYYEERFDKTE